MPIRLSNIRLHVNESELALGREVNRALGLSGGEAPRWRILRKSLDARDKTDLSFVYAVEVALPDSAAAATDEARLVERLNRRRTGIAADLYDEPAFEMPAPGDAPLGERPVIVGSGPAGVFAAYFLAEQGYRPLVLERGRRVRDRIRDVAAFDGGGPHNPESNYLFGEGGAGTFSDGKLTCRASGPDVRRVLEVLAAAKGKPSILYEHRPHLGSNRLPAVVKALRQQIEAFGGEFRFDCRVEDLEISDGHLRGVMTSSGHMPASLVVLAIGHSARDTYEMLFARGVPMIQKPFQFGVRIEQPQEQVNRVQYGAERLETRLGSADYSVVARGPTNLFSFCMCAGGYVMPSVSEPGYFGTNGMSLARRDSPFANSGMMITLEPAQFGSDHPLVGMHLQRHFERLAFEAGNRDYFCPIQRADDFLAGRRTTSAPDSSYPRGVRPAEIAALVPRDVVEALHRGLPAIDRRWHGKFLENATLVGPESRGSSPVRFLRDATTLESPGIAGLCPIGEGAGYAGGIVSAALDGLRAAKAIIARYAPLERR
ncbi:MAG: NAD(P)-binding protein [Pirellulales bacterium]|nr:NAD(P)-binding protein [Pirellulales bacterium]